jgi:hypothetical protein
MATPPESRDETPRTFSHVGMIELNMERPPETESVNLRGRAFERIARSGPNHFRTHERLNGSEVH